MINPFYEIKSSNLPDKSIVDYWVDISNSETKQDSFKKLLAPESPTPMYLLGGKGTGKTHILRYYSYNAQKARAEKDNLPLTTQIKRDGFISIYIELGHFGFERFKGAGLSEKIWNEWYFYYINLLFSELYLENILDLINSSQESLDSNSNQEKFRSIINKFFFKEDLFQKQNFQEDIKLIYQLISKSRLELNKKISYIQTGIEQNFSGMKLLFDTRENHFFDIVFAIQTSFSGLEGIRVLFLIDQFEDLSEEQQVFVNTFLRHVKFPEIISLRVSGRLYAIKTNKTYSDNERVLASEVTTRFIEHFTIEDSDKRKTHKLFSKRICQKRVQQIQGIELVEDKIEDAFEKNHFRLIEEKIIKKHPDSYKRPYFDILSKQLEDIGVSEEKIEYIISNLLYQSSPLMEKKNLYLFYQRWAKRKDLEASSEEIKNSLKVYLEDKHKKTLHSSQTLSHVEEDLMYQLLSAYRQPIHYCGFETILQMTQSNPRAFINIMKHLYEHADFAGESVFSGEALSCKVQNRAIREVSEWFWKDAITDIKDYRAIVLVERICELFKSIRLTSKPSEKSLISFAYKDNSSSITEVIQVAKNHSLLIEDTSGKKAKNQKGIMLRKFQINPLLSPKWDLPIDVGGTIELSDKQINLLTDSNESWQSFRNNYIKKLNAPFSVSQDSVEFVNQQLNSEIQPSLF